MLIKHSDFTRLNAYIGKKKRKFPNKTTICWLEHRHDSVFESDYCNELSLLKKAGQIKNFESQVDIELCVNEQKICVHRVDFEVTFPDGHIEWHEAKGFGTAVWQLKQKLTEALFPETPYVVIRQTPAFKPRMWRRGRS